MYNLHKPYIRLSGYPLYPHSSTKIMWKVVHLEKCRFHAISQLYTKLSTLSTGFFLPTGGFYLLFIFVYFCEHLIKFIFLTTFFPYPIDKPGRPRIVFELLYTFFTFLNFLIFHVFWLSFTEFCVILKPSQTKELILCVTQSAEKISTLHQA